MVKQIIEEVITWGLQVLASYFSSHVQLTRQVHIKVPH